MISRLSLLAAAVALVGAGAHRHHRHRRRLDSSGSRGEYAIVVDAGSTGSRLHLFEYAARVFEDAPPPLTIPAEETEFSLKTHPGINSATGRTNLAALLQTATTTPPLNTLSTDQIGNIPIFLYATAGARILNGTYRNEAFESVRTILRDSPFSFSRDDQARVLAGEEEGVFGWISLNRQQGLLPLPSPSPGAPPPAYVGALDLGGASTQITFVPDPGYLSNLFNLKLETEVDVNLYTHSFLYFGQNEAAARVDLLAYIDANPGHVEQLVATGGHIASHDESRQGWEEVEGHVNPDALYRPVLETTAPDTSASTAIPNPCLLSGSTYGVAVRTVGPNVTMVGTSSFDDCVAYAHRLLNNNVTCLTDPAPAYALMPEHLTSDGLPAINPSLPRADSTCSINGVYQPPLPEGMQFIAFSAFRYLYLQLGLPGNATLGDLQAAGRAFCALSFQQANATYHPSKEELPYLAGYCFSASFAFTLLHHGYGIGLNDHTVYVDTENDYSWAYGAIIYETNAMTYRVERDDDHHRHTRGLKIAVIAVGSLLVIAVAALIITCRRKKNAAIAGHNSTVNALHSGATGAAGGYTTMDGR